MPSNFAATKKFAWTTVLLEVKKIPTELLCGLGDVYWVADSTK